MPSTIKENQPIYFAIDNVDLKVGTPDGKRQLHETGTAVYQENSTFEQLYIPFLPLTESSWIQS